MTRRKRRGRGRAAPPALVQGSAVVPDGSALLDSPNAVLTAAPPRTAGELEYEASPVRKLAVGVLCVKIALAVLVFDPGALNPFSQVKALVGHGMAVLLLGILAALALYHPRQMARRSPVHIPVAAYVVAYVLAATFALDPRVALFGAPDRSLGLVSALDSVLVYAGSVALLRTRKDLVLLGSVLALTTVLLLGYALVQKLGLDPIPWSSGIGQDRPFATTGNPGVLGQYMATVFAAASAFAILTGRRARRVAAASAAIAMAALVGSLFAGARSSLIGVAAGGLVVGVSVGARIRRGGRAFVAAGSLVAIAVILAVGLSAFGVGGQALTGGISEAVARVAAGGSVGGRMDIYRVAFQEFQDRPILGVGPDNYVVAYPRYRSADHVRLHESDAAQTSTHSWFWKIATDAGVLGLAAFLAVGLVGLATGLHKTRASSLTGPISTAGSASLVAYLGTGFFSIDHIATAWMPWAALGVIVVSSGLGVPAEGMRRSAVPDRSRRRPGAQRWTRRRGVGLALILASCLLAPISFRALEASHEAEAARRAYQSGEPKLEIMGELAERAVSLDPGAAEYWNLLGLAQLGSARADRAIESFRRASDVAPYQHTYLINLAEAHAEAGDTAAAVATARRAVELDPYTPRVHYALAVVLQRAGENTEALSVLERAEGLDRETPVVADQVAARAHLRLGDTAQAIARASQGLSLASGPARLDLQSQLIQALLQSGARSHAARELLIMAGVAPEDSRTRQLHEATVEAGVTDVLTAEDFEQPPDWTVEQGRDLGTVSRNVLTAGDVGPWRVLTSLFPSNARVSVQFRVRQPILSTGPTFQIGRWIDPDNFVSIGYLPPGGVRLLGRVAGQTLQVDTPSYDAPEPSRWYWLELDISGTQVTGIFYESGPEPVSKAAASMRLVLTAELPSQMGEAPVFLSATGDPAVQLGGLDQDGGGFYVEAVR